ncbi:MAG: hypothetical protein JSS81_02635 [Acidobacteria bacterium]|nr:hypothetical protein [Acidobacteriota bacterium]
MNGESGGGLSGCENRFREVIPGCHKNRGIIGLPANDRMIVRAANVGLTVRQNTKNPKFLSCLVSVFGVFKHRAGYSAASGNCLISERESGLERWPSRLPTPRQREQTLRLL